MRIAGIILNRLIQSVNQGKGGSAIRPYATSQNKQVIHPSANSARCRYGSAMIRPSIRIKNIMQIIRAQRIKDLSRLILMMGPSTNTILSTMDIRSRPNKTGITIPKLILLT